MWEQARWVAFSLSRRLRSSDALPTWSLSAVRCCWCAGGPAISPPPPPAHSLPWPAVSAPPACIRKKMEHKRSHSQVPAPCAQPAISHTVPSPFSTPRCRLSVVISTVVNWAELGSSKADVLWMQMAAARCTAQCTPKRGMRRTSVRSTHISSMPSRSRGPYLRAHGGSRSAELLQTKTRASCLLCTASLGALTSHSAHDSTISANLDT